ncbi:MAG TPA: hypothetical protein VMJ14_08980 [Burkholderiales bacterium]|nr:hypothetical protein [Burkholderiales bacterium]
MPFATLFSNVAARLFGAMPTGGAGTAEPELVRVAVEEIVNAVDPRLRTVSRYQSKIAPGAERTIAYLRALGSSLPAPIELSRAAWSTDPLLNAYFATAGDLSALLGRCEELRTFFAAPANAPTMEAHALLGMLKTERSVFAPAIVNGALQQDVAQTTVSFGKHRLLAPAVDALECRRQVGMLILRRLAGLALERITALGERAVDLEQRKAMLGSRLRMLSLRRNGIEEIAGGAGDASAEIASIEGELKATVDDYVEVKASLATLDTHIEHVNAIFNAPANCVSLARTELRVDQMGYKIAQAPGEQAPPLVLSELSIGSGLTIVIAFVRCPRAELPPREDLIARAARELL